MLPRNWGGWQRPFQPPPGPFFLFHPPPPNVSVMLVASRSIASTCTYLLPTLSLLYILWQRCRVNPISKYWVVMWRGGGIRGSLRSFILEGHRDSILFSLSWAGAAVRLQGFFLHFHLSLFSTSTNVIFILFCSIQAISRRLEDAWIARIWRSTF